MIDTRLAAASNGADHAEWSGTEGFGASPI